MGKQTEPAKIFGEYKDGTEYKNTLGNKGLFEQSKINERMFVGDQWYGAKCGNNRPLVRRNFIKRIGEYKMSTITAAPIAVNYTADGIPDNTELKQQAEVKQQAMINGETFNGETDNAEFSLIMNVMSDYFKVTAERLKLDAKKEQAVKNAYISGTGIAYTYWDDQIRTGIYVDEAKSTPVKGDIAFEILDVENVVFGDPNNDDVQSQPFIIVSQRKFYKDVQREAKRNKRPSNEIEMIKPNGIEGYYENAGERGENELSDSKRVTVLTKFWKEWNEDGTEYKIMCVRVTDKAVIREPWNLSVKNYPFAKFCWERRRSCAYGDSEITHLVPNQIAINRAYTAMLWSIMTTGMPITLVNGDIISDKIKNEPGEVLRVFGAEQDISNAIRFIQPPAFAGQIKNTVSDLVTETLSDSGATEAALGAIRPDNAAAIIQMREAALQPMQVYQNRFYDFVEDVARIWSDFWLNCYGNRQIKVENKDGSYYLNFNAERYRDLLINARVDVGASTLWSSAAVVTTLDNLLERQLITFEQYLERLPAGLIPDVTGLKNDIKAQTENATAISDSAIIQQISQQQPELYQKYLQMTPEEQQQMLQQIKMQAGIGGGANVGQPVT